MSYTLFSQKEIEYLILPQWFLSILPHKQKFIELGDAIEWYPSFMKSRYANWVENISWDWCLSLAPTILCSDGRPVLAAGGAGGTRLRPALVQVLSSILDEGWDPQDAVDRPRLHSTGELVHLEPGFSDEAVAVLEAEYQVQLWSAPHHYFGGVSLLAESGGAADPRRSGAARAQA